MTGDSLQARVAARREQQIAARARSFLVPLPGFEDLLAARYHPLGFEIKRQIQIRHEQIGSDPADEVAASADILIAACDEVRDAETGATLAAGWTAGVVRDVFGLTDLPESATVRQALIVALGADGVMAHFGGYHREANRILDASEEKALGESTPALAG